VYANAYGSHLKPERGAVALTEADKVQQGIPSEETVERKQEETESGGRRAIPTTTYRPPTPVPQPPAAVQVSANKFHHAVVAALSVPTAIWQFLRRD
jgi:hypothetical protein